jgi:hypothetical protein
MLFRVARRVNHKSIAQRGSPQGITSGRAKALYVAVRRHPSTVSPGVLLVGCKIKVKGGRQVSAPHDQNPRRFAFAQRAGCVSLRDGEARAGSRPSRNGNRVGHFWLTGTFRLSLWHGRVEKAQELSGLVAAPSVGPGAKSGFLARNDNALWVFTCNGGFI